MLPHHQAQYQQAWNQPMPHPMAPNQYPPGQQYGYTQYPPQVGFHYPNNIQQPGDGLQGYQQPHGFAPVPQVPPQLVPPTNTQQQIIHPATPATSQAVPAPTGKAPPKKISPQKKQAPPSSASPAPAGNRKQAPVPAGPHAKPSAKHHPKPPPKPSPGVNPMVEG